MKSTYILDTYESVVREIKNCKRNLDPLIDDYLSKNYFDNYVLFPIHFPVAQDENTYVIENKIHSLHPRAADLMDLNLKSNHSFEIILPKIRTTLKLENAEVEYFWLEKKTFVSLYIKVYCNFPKESVDLKLIKYCNLVLRHENEKIEYFIKTKISKLKNLKECRQFIRKKHHSITALLETLCQRIEPSSIGDFYIISENFDRIDSFKVIFMYCEKLLFFLENQYFEFINSDSFASVPFIFRYQEKMEIKAATIAAVITRSNLDADLKGLVLRPLSKIIDNLFHERYSYTELNYRQKYCNYFYKMCSDSSSEIVARDVENLLIFLNFNALVFLKYYIKRMRLKKKSFATNAEQIEFLSHSLKKLKQEVKQEKLKYKPNLPSVMEQLTSWKKEEIQYLKDKALSQKTDKAGEFGSNSKKLLSGFSVAQMSYFTTLLIEVNVIDDENRADVFRVISERFKTKNCENISPDSLRKKSYSVEDSTVQAVREKLLELLKLTDS